MVDKWDVLTTWQCVLPPSRPDNWQLSIIKEHLTAYKNPVVAVLGATIEFRDLLAECNISKVYVFEKNHHYFTEISQYRKHKNDEMLVWGDWLTTIKNYEGKFDVILSDLTSGNISYEQRDNFYKYISSALTPKGVFIDRILTKPNQFISEEFLIEKYKRLPATNRNANDFNCEFLFCSTLLDNDENVVNSSHFYDHLLSLQNSQINQFVNLCYLITPRNCIWWYSKPWYEEKIIYERYLSIVESYDEPITSAYFGRAKLFLSKKKEQ